MLNFTSSLNERSEAFAIFVDEKSNFNDKKKYHPRNRETIYLYLKNMKL